MKERILIEDALKHLHDCEYQGRRASPQSLAGALGISLDQSVPLLENLVSSGLAALDGGAHRLTPDGRSYALHVIRAHRLYETFLARETGLRQQTWHEKAETAEHRLSAEDADRLARRLGDPRFDPHGDPIPTRDGQIPPSLGASLLETEAGWEGRIAHLEDEPPTVFADLARAGLAPGLRVRVLGGGPDGVRINAEGRSLLLSRPMAANVMVRGFEGAEKFDETVSRLSDLLAGEKASVVALSPACRGAERNRLLDLGIVPGTAVEVGLRSLSGSPTAYRVRGAMIALRRSQADGVLIRKQEATT